MKTDVIQVTNAGAGMEDALQAASAAAVYRGLDRKSALHLRLLAEEMLGMMRQITGETEAEFWVGSEGPRFELHLLAHPLVTGSMRKELLKASTSGKNAAAKGFMGKLRDIFDRALASEGMGDLADYYAQGVVLPGDVYVSDPMAMIATSSMVTWSLQKYKQTVEGEKAGNGASKEQWDELERSIVASIADEVQVAVTGDKVEMTVYKTFAN